MNGCQRYLIDEIAKAIDEGIRHFVVLKARQLGISTVLLALDNWWLSYFPGTQGAIIVNSDDNRSYFRSVRQLMQDTVPPKFRIRQIRDNNYFLLLANKSRASYLVAGMKKKKDKKTSLGRAKGLNYLHGTEISDWADEDSLKSLMSSLAEIYENRFYIFESTAQGFDLWFDMWETAKRAHTQRAIFIGWWRNENYAIQRNDKRFSLYWDDLLTHEEEEWIREIKELYGFDISTEQVAWYRWKYEEHMKDPNKGAAMMRQEYPHTEHHAFILTGTKFFSTGRLTEDYKRSLDIVPRYFKYHFGYNFYDTEIEETNEWNADLALWEEPRPNGVYVIGADAAFGGNQNSDAHAAQVGRAYADRVKQAVEFRNPYITTTQYAWVLAHLGGAFSGLFNQCALNLETNGPGAAVLDELNKIQEMSSVIPNTLLKEEKTFKNVVPNIAYFIGLNPRGVNVKNFTIGWNTSKQTRAWIFNTLRSMWELKYVGIFSPWLLREMRYVSQDGQDIVIESSAKSDRVVAMALMVYHWYMYLVPELKPRNMIFEVEQTKERLEKENTGVSNAISRVVGNYFAKKGVEM